MTITDYLRVENTTRRHPCPLCSSSDGLSFGGKARAPTGLWHCFACEAGGDGIDYLRQAEGMTYRQACAALGAKLPSRDPDDVLARVLEQRSRRAQRQAYWQRLYALFGGTGTAPAMPQAVARSAPDVVALGYGLADQIDDVRDGVRRRTIELEKELFPPPALTERHWRRRRAWRYACLTKAKWRLWPLLPPAWRAHLTQCAIAASTLWHLDLWQQVTTWLRQQIRAGAMVPERPAADAPEPESPTQHDLFLTMEAQNGQQSFNV